MGGEYRSRGPGWAMSIWAGKRPLTRALLLHRSVIGPQLLFRMSGNPLTALIVVAAACTHRVRAPPAPTVPTPAPVPQRAARVAAPATPTEPGPPLPPIPL